MIEIYELQSLEGGYELMAEIDETDASVTGDSYLAEYFRAGFNEMRDEGYVPADHMDGIRDRLRRNWNSGTYATVIT
jgi:hypothetical protein